MPSCTKATGRLHERKATCLTRLAWTAAQPGPKESVYTSLRFSRRFVNRLALTVTFREPSLQIPMPLGTTLNTVILAGAIKYWLYVPRHAGPTPAKAICRAVAALRPAPLQSSAGPLLQAYSSNNCLLARPSSASADCPSFLKLKVSLLRICI